MSLQPNFAAAEPGAAAWDFARLHSFAQIFTPDPQATLVLQARVAYYWYKKTRRQCQAQGRCHMGGFTRLLHSGVADELMAEVPTVVVKPLQDRDHGGCALGAPVTLEARCHAQLLPLQQPSEAAAAAAGWLTSWWRESPPS